MVAPFIFGKIAQFDEFTDREDDLNHLLGNFRSLVSTAIISPRRWGKTSLVNRAVSQISREKGYLACMIDIFNSRSEEQFYHAYVNAVLHASSTRVEEFTAMAKKYIGSLGPKLTLGDGATGYELTLGIDFKDKRYSTNEILDLPQRIAQDRRKKFIVCIDEFQNVGTYEQPVELQRKLRSHWQMHDKVGYCFLGSKRHMMVDIFASYDMPFYKFGDIMFLQKIGVDDWTEFIVRRFSDTGKRISPQCARDIALRVECHPYYVQQLAQLSWLRTVQECDAATVGEAFDALVDQLSLLFSNLIDSLKARQINFLLAVAHGETRFTSADVLRRYDLGTSANVKNLRTAMLGRDLIDSTPQDGISLQDPIFAYWLKERYCKGRA